MIDNIVVLGFVYPGVEPYLDDYFHSLSIQTNHDFHLYIYNDGLDKDLLNNFLIKYQNLNIKIISIKENYSPAQIREIAIIELADKYSYMIFTDTDDYFSSNRIEKSVIALQSYDFCYNDMYLVNSFGFKFNTNSYFINKNNPSEVYQYEQLLDKNFCGLSNTAINLNSIHLNKLKIPSELIAVDWWIFSVLVMEGYRGCFINDAYTYYRQHNTNTVGGLNIINEKQLIKGIQVKVDHYKRLLEYYPSKYDDIIKNEYNSIVQLSELILNKNMLNNYLNNVNNGNNEFLWWENIKLNKRWVQE